MKPNTFRRMQTLVHAVLALAASSAYGCVDPCVDPGPELVTVLAPANGGGPDASSDAGASLEAGAFGDAGFAKAKTELGTSDCLAFCGDSTASCAMLPPVGGATIVECHRSVRCSAAGRRPEGFALPPVHESDAVARHFVEMAWLELASVDAFERLADELAHHRAPHELVQRARLAADDERSHAQKTAEIAKAFGANLPEATFVLAPSPFGPARSLLEIGRENAIEGCVAETFAALLVERQAQLFSLDSNGLTAETVRSTLRSIARDELSHAALAYAVDDWLRTMLTPHEQATLDRARHREVARLTGAAASRPLTVAPRPDALGLPSPSLSLRLAQDLFRTIRAHEAGRGDAQDELRRFAGDLPEHERRSGERTTVQVSR